MTSLLMPLVAVTGSQARPVVIPACSCRKIAAALPVVLHIPATARVERDTVGAQSRACENLAKDHAAAAVGYVVLGVVPGGS